MGWSTKQPPPPSNNVPILPEQLSSNQQTVPVPLWWGRRKITGRWISPAFDQIAKQIKNQGKKGDKAGNSGGFVSYNYYGTIACVLRAGAISSIRQVLVDGQFLWSGPVNRTDPGVGNPYTLVLADSSRLTNGGYVKLYWGDDTQTVPDGSLTGHPPYRGFAYLVFHNFLFGQDRTSMGNVEIIADAVPNPPASIIAATAPNADGSGNVNLWAVLADLLTSIHGCALPSTRLDPTSWQAIHDYFAASPDRRFVTYCSPKLIDQTQLQSFCNDLTSLCDGGLRLKSDGTIEAFYYPVDPGDLSAYQTLTSNDLESAAKVNPDAWDAVHTGCRVNIEDADQWFVSWDVALTDQRALLQAIEPKWANLNLPFIVYRGQALKVASEWNKRNCQPQLTGTITVRPERAVNLDGSPLRVGSRFLLDIQPEPGGDAFLQLCRVVARRFKATGPVTIDFKGEVNQPLLASTTTYTPPTIEEIDVAAVASALIIPMPVEISGEIGTIGVLANRGDDLTVGAHVLFDVDGGSGTFTQLGDQPGFAVPCQLVGDYANDAITAVRLTLTDTRDEDLALIQPGNSGSQNDELLIMIYKTAGGYIDENADGTAKIEWMSVVSSAAVSGDTYDFTVIRGRLGTLTADWNDGDSAWIVPKVNLIAFAHTNFPQDVVDHTNLVFRLSPFSRFSEFSGVPANLAFHFPTSWERAPKISWTTPATFSDSLPGSGHLTPAATITDIDGNTVKISLYYVRQDTGVQTKVFEVLVAPTYSIDLADCFTLANVATPIVFPSDPVNDLYYTLTVRAEDAAGNVVESQRYLLMPSSGGGSPLFAPPTFTPSSGSFANSYTFAVDAVAPATKMQAAGANYGGALPGSGSWATINAIHFAGFGYTSRRLFARAGDGVNWSAWVFVDYLKVG